MTGHVSIRLALVAIGVAVVALAPVDASAKKRPGGGGGGFSTTSTYVKSYADVLDGVQYDLTPADVQATRDGGWAGLAITQAPSGVGVAWLLKASAVGEPQWQEEVGCFDTPPGAYSDALSLRQTSDGGYVLAGGTLGCGSGANCPSSSGIQCGLVERLDSAGGLVWARVYSAGANGTAIEQIEQTGDGGFVAVGSATDADHATGALVLKLDAGGAVEWQRRLGPTSTSQAYLNAVRQTSDGGYIAVGELDDGTQSSLGLPRMSVLAVKLDAAGDVTWQQAFNDVSSTGVTASEHALSVVQASDGGYAIGGAWNSTTAPGTCCQGALLVKLAPSGSIQWQRAYSGGVYCFFNGYSETCRALGGIVYSVQQTADGGYVLAGGANLKLLDDTPLVPWLARVDAAGALVWQENDYEANPSTGRPVSEYFASSALTAAGPLALGFTESATNGLGELLGVQTDPGGNVATCSQIHPATVLSAIDPGLASVPAALSPTTGVASQSPAPVLTRPTTIAATQAQC